MTDFPIVGVHKEVADRHCDFLQSLDQSEAWRHKMWKKLLNEEPEAALSEAYVRKWLADSGLNVEPWEHPSVGGPDFLCHTACGNRFYVEVTCIKIATATRNSGLPPFDERPANTRPIADLYQVVWEELSSKASQLGKLDAPSLVCIHTFHDRAAGSSFYCPLRRTLITGEQYISFPISIGDRRDIPTEQRTRTTTELKGAAFHKRLSPGFVAAEYARQSISGFMVLSFATKPALIQGYLHENPARVFDPSWLPAESFLTTRTGGKGMRVMEVGRPLPFESNYDEPDYFGD